jgi:phospholipid-translocating ATPase
LRTLCYAKAILDPVEYEDWAEDFLEAQSATQGRDKLTQELAEKIEINLTLLGATGKNQEREKRKRKE